MVNIKEIEKCQIYACSFKEVRYPKLVMSSFVVSRTKSRYSLGVGVNHLDGDGLFSGDSGGDLRSKDICSVVNRAVTDQQTFSHLGNFLVKGRHNVGQSFNEGNLATQGSVDVRKFQSNVSRSNDSNPLRNTL